MLSFESFSNRLVVTRERLKSRRLSESPLTTSPMCFDAWKANFPNGKAVRELLDLSFFLSLEQYEGRQIRTTIYCLLTPFGPRYIQRFERDLPASTKQLRQLSQVAAGSNSAIEVKLGDRVTIAGVIQIPSNMNPGYLFAPGIRIKVKGPGHIEYLEGTFATCYCRGIRKRLRKVTDHPRISKWLASARNHISKRACELDRPELSDPMDATAIPENIFLIFLEAMLVTIEAGGHGGAILVIPNHHELKELRLGYESDMRDPLADLARRFMIDSQFAKGSGFYASSPEFDVPRLLVGQIREYGIACGQLANCDGAIVITEGGIIKGFAGIICPPAIANDTNELLTHRGARHNSAFWCCKSIPGSLALVVSSDGGITVMQNNQNDVEVTADLVV